MPYPKSTREVRYAFPFLSTKEGTVSRESSVQKSAVRADPAVIGRTGTHQTLKNMISVHSIKSARHPYLTP